MGAHVKKANKALIGAKQGEIITEHVCMCGVCDARVRPGVVKAGLTIGAAASRPTRMLQRQGMR